MANWCIATGLFSGMLFTEFILGLFVNEPVNKSRHYVLSILLGLFGDNSVKTKELNQTLGDN